MASRLRSARLAALVLVCAGCGDPAAPSLDATGPATTGESTAEAPTSGAASTTGDPDTTGEPLPACCGCLCVDPDRSCGANTCTPEGGGPAPLAAEAGFAAIPGHPISVLTGADAQAWTAATSRLWYGFLPADDDPAARPLVVFFNGGPGISTAVLFGANTGAWTFDPHVAGDAIAVPNPHAWTRFANLLYVDPPEAGYSHDLAPGGDPPPLPFIPEHDAALVAWFLLDFLADHPQLRKNPVILVGESWGGVRATLIGHHLLFARDLVDGPVYRNAGLHAAVQAHLAAVFPDLDPDDPATAARQFGHRALIQPVISTGLELDVQLPRTPPDAVRVLQGCVDLNDPYQCDEPGGWTIDHTDAIVRAVVRPDALSQALGLDVRDIAWMHADARADARPRAPMEGFHAEDETALRAAFGPLPDGDHYYLRRFRREHLPDAFYAAHPGYGRMFVATLPYVRTFVTNAGKDALVYSPDLVDQIAWHADLVAHAARDDAPVGDEARPGRLRVEFQPATGWSPVFIRFPPYPAAGHMVTARAPGELLADVARWYAGD